MSLLLPRLSAQRAVQNCQRLLATALLCAIVACGAGGSSDGQSTGDLAQGDAPNIVLIVLDDWSWADYGAKTQGIVTPNIDSIAANGFSFDNAFLTTSSCSPSRASILMGRYPTATGAPHLHDEVPAGFTSIPEQLRQAGYYTESAGKWHLGGAFRERFDRVRPDRKTGAEDKWVDILRERPANKPFFYWLSAFDPHLPHEAPERFRVHVPDEVTLPPYLADAPATRRAYTDYLDEVHRVDFYIGQVIEELRAQGVLNNTWLFVMADNGAPIPLAKTMLYDSGIKTPLLVLGPSGKGTFPGLVSIVDLAPTLMELAGLPVASDFQGKSFAAAFSDADYTHRDTIYAEQNNHGRLISRTAVRSLDYLLIRNNYAQFYCLAEMHSVWNDMVKLQKNGGGSAQQARCFDPPAPATTEFFTIRGASPEAAYQQGHETREHASSLSVSPAQKELQQRLDEWQRRYRGDACTDIQCARLKAAG